MGVTGKDVGRNPPQIHCTAKGYMKMSTSGWNSRGKESEKQVMELAQEHRRISYRKAAGKKT